MVLIDEDEEEGFDSTMSFGLGYGYGEDYGLTIIRSPSPPPLSPLWTFSDNPIPTETRYIEIKISRCFLKTVASVNLLCSKCRKKVMKLIASIEGVNSILLDLSKNTATVIGEADPVTIIKKMRKFRSSAQIVSIGPPKDDKKDSDKKDTNTVMPALPRTCQKCDVCLIDPISPSPREELLYQDAAFLYHKKMLDANTKIKQRVEQYMLTLEKTNVLLSKLAINESRSLSLEDPVQHLTITREEASNRFGDQARPESERDTLSRTLFIETPKKDGGLNKAPMSLQDLTSSIVEETHGTCEADGFSLNTINQKKRTVSSGKSAITGSSLSLEDLQKHCSMTREKAAESLGVSVPTNPSLCHVQPMVPLISLEEYRDVASSTVKPTQGSEASENLDSEEEKSMVGCDAINGEDGIGEAEGRTSSRKRTSISLEELQQHCYMTRDEAAKKLGVSVSTLKRACREHQISNWLHLKRRKKSGQSPSEPKSMNVTKQDNIAAGSSQTDLRAVEPVQEVKFVIVKAKYLDKMIKFQLPSLSEMVKLEEEMAKRLKLEVGSFSIEYVDEANDQILLACSEDLQYCIDTWTSHGKAEIIMIVKLATTN